MRSVSHIRAATATDVATVDEKRTRKTPIPLSFWFASSASISPRRIATGTVYTAKRNVIQSACRKSTEVRTERY